MEMYMYIPFLWNEDILESLALICELESSGSKKGKYIGILNIDLDFFLIKHILF